MPDQSAERRPHDDGAAAGALRLELAVHAGAGEVTRRRTDKLASEARVRRLYQLVFARDPRENEAKAAERFLRNATDKDWSQYAQVLLLTNEAMFVD